MSHKSEDTGVPTADGNGLTKEHVIWAYRLLLDRDPESDAVIAEKLQLENTKDLRRNFMLSPEFGAKNPELTLFHESHIVITELANKLRIFVDLSDTAIGWNVIRGLYEKAELDFVRRTVKPGQNVVDIGANIGIFTLTMASLVGPAGKVYAFEPLETEAMLLAQSLAENGFNDRVVLERAAASNQNGTAQLISAAETINAGGAYLNLTGEPLPAGHRISETELITLDTYPLRRPVSFIKIDIEGAEPLALRGARRLLQEDRPVILSELHPAQLMKVAGCTPAEFIAELERLNYRCYELLEAELTPYQEDNSEVKPVVFLPAR
jgi:FkbM family methyltransferase